MTPKSVALPSFHRHLSAALLLALLFMIFAAPARAIDVELSPIPPPELRAISFGDLSQRAISTGAVPVIVGLAVPFVPEGDLPDKAAVAAQRAKIHAAQGALEADLAPRKLKIKRKYKYIPYMALK